MLSRGRTEDYILGWARTYCAIQISENICSFDKTLLRATSPLGDFRHGAVAQLVERLLCKQDVRSSSLLCSTTLLDRSGL